MTTTTSPERPPFVALGATQLQTMLELQDKMNARVNPQWLTSGYLYQRAIVIEGAEGIEHHGWKWWKKQSCDMPQLQMELVDIAHFLWSAILVNHGGEHALANQWVRAELAAKAPLQFDGKVYDPAALDIPSKLEMMIAVAAVRRVHMPLFEALLADCQMNWDSLSRLYVGKNVLNFFRQDHGYKEGTYLKEWQGREDNEHLSEILGELDASASDLPEQIYRGLKQRYAAAAPAARNAP